MSCPTATAARHRSTLMPGGIVFGYVVAEPGTFTITVREVPMPAEPFEPASEELSERLTSLLTRSVDRRATFGTARWLLRASMGLGNGTARTVRRTWLGRR